jgi:hypothetical protein
VKTNFNLKINVIRKYLELQTYPTKPSVGLPNLVRLSLLILIYAFRISKFETTRDAIAAFTPMERNCLAEEEYQATSFARYHIQIIIFKK